MVPPCFAPILMSLRASAHTGVAIPIEKHGASKRFNGRTRGCLPIDTPAPRPCSADPDPPHHTNRGSLNGFACVLFSSQLLQIYELIIQSKNPIVNRQITIYRTGTLLGGALSSLGSGCLFLIIFYCKILAFFVLGLYNRDISYYKGR